MAKPLSQAPQALLDAAFNTDFEIDFTNLDATFEASIKQIVAGVAESLADQVVPYLEEPDWGACDEMRCDIELYTDHMRKRSEILAIAAELRGQDQSTRDSAHHA